MLQMGFYVRNQEPDTAARDIKSSVQKRSRSTGVVGMRYSILMSRKIIDWLRLKHFVTTHQLSRQGVKNACPCG